MRILMPNFHNCPTERKKIKKYNVVYTYMKSYKITSNLKLLIYTIKTRLFAKSKRIEA
jgi:hypothetical protein